MNKIPLLIYLSILFIFPLFGQDNKKDEIIISSQSVDSLLVWFDNGLSADKIPYLSAIPENQIMEQLLFRKEKKAILFSDALYNFSSNHYSPQNDYLLNTVYEDKEQIRLLKQEIKRTIFESQPIEYLKAFFPDDFILSPEYNIFFCATGWQWGDAMAFNYIINDDNYILAQEGTSGIIFNLTIINSTYGKTVEEKVATFRKVLKHELFHALLSDYIAGKSYYSPQQIESQTLYMLMNEGMAHFVDDTDFINENYNNLREKEEENFSLFSEKAKIIFDEKEPFQVRKEAMVNGLFGPYWNKYICITGLFMTYHIYQFGGQELLKECIEKGYRFFIDKYIEVCEINKDLLQLPRLFYSLPKIIAPKEIVNCHRQ